MIPARFQGNSSYDSQELASKLNCKYWKAFNFKNPRSCSEYTMRLVIFEEILHFKRNEFSKTLWQILYYTSAKSIKSKLWIKRPRKFESIKRGFRQHIWSIRYGLTNRSQSWSTIFIVFINYKSRMLKWNGSYDFCRVDVRWEQQSRRIQRYD